MEVKMEVRCFTFDFQMTNVKLNLKTNNLTFDKSSSRIKYSASQNECQNRMEFKRKSRSDVSQTKGRGQIKIKFKMGKSNCRKKVKVKVESNVKLFDV